MSNQNAKPAFGARLKTPEYYAQIHAFCAVLKGKSTLRSIAEALNRAGFRSPANLPFDRQKVANFLRNTSV